MITPHLNFIIAFPTVKFFINKLISAPPEYKNVTESTFLLISLETGFVDG